MLACGQCLFSISHVLAIACTSVYPITYVTTKLINKIK
jgi:hypothetical protein